MSNVVSSLAVLALAALAACAPRTEWAKPGTNAADLRMARESCAAEANRYNFFDSGRGQDYEADARDRRVGAGQGDLYRLCMESRGWRQQRIQDKPAAAK